jgi:hypothetical protein
MMKRSVVTFATGLMLVAAAFGAETFTGTVTDTMCGKDHAAMKVSPDSRCVVECVKAGAKYALYDGKKVYVLSDQVAPAKFAAQKVKVTGTLDAKTSTIKVQSIQAAK